MSQTVPPRLNYDGTRKVPANFCNLRHTNEEFILDVGLSGADPTSTAIEIDTSIVVSPFTAKRLWASLGTLVANYEQTFGEIEVEAENRAIAPRPTPLAAAPPIPERRSTFMPKGKLDHLPPVAGATTLPPAAAGVFPLDVLGGGFPNPDSTPPEPNAYSRVKLDGAKESLDDTLRRVVECTHETPLEPDNSPCIPAGFEGQEGLEG